MKNQISIFTFGDEYQCTEFYNVDLNYGGVEVSSYGKHLGSIIGVGIPDIDDDDEIEKFTNEVINWLVDNN
jgi:hypothetical protein